MTEEVPEGSELFDAISRNFAEAVRRAMRVAAVDEDGELTPVSQTDLAKDACIGRSTLAKFLGTGAADPAANPTLEVLCRIADTLGVPPAFLLMRPSDWSNLATGALTYFDAARSVDANALFTSLVSQESTTSQEVGKAVVKVGRLLNTIGNDRDERQAPVMREFYRATKASTAAIAATIPFRHGAVEKNKLPVLLTMCCIAGVKTGRD